MKEPGLDGRHRDRRIIRELRASRRDALIEFWMPPSRALR